MTHVLTKMARKEGVSHTNARGTEVNTPKKIPAYSKIIVVKERRGQHIPLHGNEKRMRCVSIGECMFFWSIVCCDYYDTAVCNVAVVDLVLVFLIPKGAT